MEKPNRKIKDLDAAKILDECVFKTSKSSGPGGQHVNKTESRVTLEWDFSVSSALDDVQKSVIAQKAHNYLIKDSILQISSEVSRSQLKNKEDAQRKLIRFIEQSLVPKKKRKLTKPTFSSVQDRLKGKKIASQKKAFRSGRDQRGD